MAFRRTCSSCGPPYPFVRWSSQARGLAGRALRCSSGHLLCPKSPAVVLAEAPAEYTAGCGERKGYSFSAPLLMKPSSNCLLYYYGVLAGSEFVRLFLCELISSNWFASCRQARRPSTWNPGSGRKSAWVCQRTSGVSTKSCGRRCVPRYLDVLM